MRYFTSTVSRQMLYHVDPESDPKLNYVQCRDVLLPIMEAKLGELVPSEQSVLRDLSSWVYSIRACFEEKRHSDNSAFVHSNLNTGKICVFIVDHGYGEVEGRTLGW